MVSHRHGRAPLRPWRAKVKFPDGHLTCRAIKPSSRPSLQGGGRGGLASVASHPRLATRGIVSIRNRSDGHQRGTAFLKRKCWRVLRLWNSGVLANAVSAPSKFGRKPPSSSAAPTPGPSLAGRGEKEVRDAVERCTADQRAHRNPGWPTPLA
jgi:hypothetical protein